MRPQARSLSRMASSMNLRRRCRYPFRTAAYRSSELSSTSSYSCMLFARSLICLTALRPKSAPIGVMNHESGSMNESANTA
jgi:hypothetical protein